MAKQPAFKAATPRAIPAPPALVLDEPILQEPVPQEPILEAVAEPILEAPIEPVEPTLPAGPRRLRVTPPYGYPIHIAGQGIVVRPGTVTEVEEDAWVRAQLRAGIFREA